MKYAVRCKRVKKGIYQELKSRLRHKFTNINNTIVSGCDALDDMLYRIKDKELQKKYRDILGSELCNSADLDGLLALSKLGFKYDRPNGSTPKISVTVNSAKYGRYLISSNKAVLEDYFGVEVFLPPLPAKKDKVVNGRNPNKSYVGVNY